MSYRPEWEEQGSGGQWITPRFGWSATSIILAVCVAMFVILAISENFLGSYQIRRWLMLSVENMVFVYPFFTYIFLHDTLGIGHLLMNGLVLYFFGTRVEQAIGRSRYLALFFLSGLVGAIAHVVLSSVFFAHQPASLYGASGAALGVLFYAAWAWPHSQVIFFIFPMRLRTLAFILLAFDLYPILIAGPGADQVAHFCHLGGAGMGVLFWKFRMDPFRVLGEWSEKRRVAEFHRREQHDRDDDAKVDLILAKIKDQGIGSLSSSERKLLDARSKSLREGRGR